MIDAPDTGSHRQRARLLIAILLCLLFVAAAWQWSPLPAYLDVGADDFLHLLERLRQLPILAIVMVMLASIVAIPLGLIIVAGVLVFGPLYGAVYILVGAELGALVSFSIGKYIGHTALNLFAGERIKNISKRLGQRGFISILFLRVIPVAPFAIVNMIAGASHVRLTDFLTGTLIGMLPGVVIIGLLADRIATAISHPDWRTVLGVLVIIVLVVLGLAAMKRWLGRHAKEADEGK